MSSLPIDQWEMAVTLACCRPASSGFQLPQQSRSRRAGVTGAENLARATRCSQRQQAGVSGLADGRSARQQLFVNSVKGDYTQSLFRTGLLTIWVGRSRVSVPFKSATSSETTSTSPEFSLISSNCSCSHLLEAVYRCADYPTARGHQAQAAALIRLTFGCMFRSSGLAVMSTSGRCWSLH